MCVELRFVSYCLISFCDLCDFKKYLYHNRIEKHKNSGDGYVSFQEYSQQMALQAQKAEMEQMYGGGSSSSQNKAKAYQDLASGSNFEEVYRKKQQQQRGWKEKSPL